MPSLMVIIVVLVSAGPDSSPLVTTALKITTQNRRRMLEPLGCGEEAKRALKVDRLMRDTQFGEQVCVRWVSGAGEARVGIFKAILLPAVQRNLGRLGMGCCPPSAGAPAECVVI
ncbi:hypothetical protein QBC44DRAFT_318626 [Cladorrhinum sp. PSN332]|nr:hypothetical protein QBC44DRAFT_318626 [Cladorrhinum sp. PSN332]